MVKTIGEKIIEIRKSKGLSQEELSGLANINLRTLQRIEKGTSEPRGNTLKNISQVLELDVKNLLNYGKKDNRKFIRYFHLSVLACMFSPVGSVVLPLVLWLIKRDKIVELNEQGVNVLNFQILWNIILYTVMVFWFLFQIFHWPNAYLWFFVLGFLYLINIIYPIWVSILIRRGQMKNFYITVFHFIKA